MNASDPISKRVIKVGFLMQESRMGGIEYNSIHLAESLDQSRFCTIFFCPGEGKLTGQLRGKGIPYHLYRRPRFLSTSSRLGNRTIFNPVTALYNALIFLPISLPLASQLKLADLDLVVTKGLLANFYGALAARLGGIPCLWDMQEIVSNKKCMGFLSWVLNAAAKIWTDGLIVPSEAIRDQFSPNVRRKIKLIPNGIDTNQYNPAVDRSQVRNEWGVRSEEILVGHIARFTYWKGQMDFVKAASEVSRKMPNTRFVLVGSPVFENSDYEDQVKKLTDQLGLKGKAIFPGFRDDLAAVLAAIDIFVHSSTEPEGCPLTLITAMAMAKPVVATDVPGNKEIITSRNQGTLVKPGRPDGLAEAILRLATDREEARSQGQRARERILERYSLLNYAKESAATFESLLRSSRHE